MMMTMTKSMLAIIYRVEIGVTSESSWLPAEHFIEI